VRVNGKVVTRSAVSRAEEAKNYRGMWKWPKTSHILAEETRKCGLRKMRPDCVSTSRWHFVQPAHRQSLRHAVQCGCWPMRYDLSGVGAEAPAIWCTPDRQGTTSAPLSVAKIRRGAPRAGQTVEKHTVEALLSSVGLPAFPKCNDPALRGVKWDQLSLGNILSSDDAVGPHRTDRQRQAGFSKGRHGRYARRTVAA